MFSIFKLGLRCFTTIILGSSEGVYTSCLRGSSYTRGGSITLRDKLVALVALKREATRLYVFSIVVNILKRIKAKETSLATTARIDRVYILVAICT